MIFAAWMISSSSFSFFERRSESRALRAWDIRVLSCFDGQHIRSLLSLGEGGVRFDLGALRCEPKEGVHLQNWRWGYSQTSLHSICLRTSQRNNIITLT